jgi:phosphoglycerate dehydrogenase-like enzyme
MTAPRSSLHHDFWTNSRVYFWGSVDGIGTVWVGLEMATRIFISSACEVPDDMPKAVIFHDTPIAEMIQSQTTDLTVIDTESKSVVHENLSDTDIFVTNPKGWSDTFLRYLSDGNWLQATSIGYAAFPVEQLREHGVTFTNAATVHDAVVSEHALALALALSRRLGPILDQQREHTWNREVGAEMWDWKGRQMTVFGLGNIGEAIARRAQAFGFEVVGVKRTPSTYTGTLSRDRVVATDDVHDVLPDTDLLVLAVPLTDETHHIIDADVLAALPDSATLVNVARGPVVNEQILVTALENGELAGAGLDVFETEPLSSDSPLWDRDDVVVTPHVGGRSSDFPDRFTQLFVDNYDRWREGQSLVNRIA